MSRSANAKSKRNARHRERNQVVTAIRRNRREKGYQRMIRVAVPKIRIAHVEKAKQGIKYT